MTTRDTTDVASPRVSGGWRIFLPAFAVFALLSTLWALASPLYSVPDENAHVTKAVAQLHGQIIGENVEGQPFIVVDLPDGYEYNHGVMCYLFVPESPASCEASVGDGSGDNFFSTWVATYNPLYYYIVGWPSLLFDNAAVGIYAMRILSALLGSVLLAWAFQAGVAARSNRWMPLGLAFVAMPMVLYFVGSVNPNGIEIAAAAALWIALLRLLERHRAPASALDSLLSTRYLWMIVTVSSILLVNARAVGPLWLIVIVATCCIAVGWRPTQALFKRGASYPWLGAIAAGSLFAGIWTLSTGALGGQAGESDAPLVGASALTGTLVMLRKTGEWLQQAVGYFGWLDTPLPTEAYILIYVVLGVLVLLALAATDRRSMRVMIGVIALAILLPAVVQGVQVSRTGLIWQGRYGIFLYLAVPIFAAWVLSGPAGERLRFLSSRMSWLGLSLLGLYSAFAYLWVLRRYVTGTGHPSVELFTEPGWQPPLGWLPLVIAYVLVSAFFVVWAGRLAANPIDALAHTPHPDPAPTAEASAVSAQERNVEAHAELTNDAVHGHPHG